MEQGSSRVRERCPGEGLGLISMALDRLPFTELAAAHESGAVKVFGRLRDDPVRTRRRQAYEKRQWTKSREVGRLRCGGFYEGLMGKDAVEDGWNVSRRN